jgi:hypothetical protein
MRILTQSCLIFVLSDAALLQHFLSRRFPQRQYIEAFLQLQEAYAIKAAQRIDVPDVTFFTRRCVPFSVLDANVLILSSYRV